VALRSGASPAEVPIYIASLGPANLRLTGEVADGWIGNSFFCESAEIFFNEIDLGAKAVGRTIEDLNLTVAVSCEFTDFVEEAGRRHADGYAFTFGAMGSAMTNFYNQAFERQGYGPAVAEVQRLWRSGDHDSARRAVPIEIGLRTNLIGPVEEVRRRLYEYQACGVNTLRINPIGDTLDAQLAGLGQLIDVAREVSESGRPKNG
jgi:alkanesulfonate monooxygenase SsuD/methylene tetrahydromethanopterin reductase-like flavin-dependent oxidoreductase (luciferase family)